MADDSDPSPADDYKLADAKHVGEFALKEEPLFTALGPTAYEVFWPGTSD